MGVSHPEALILGRELIISARLRKVLCGVAVGPDTRARRWVFSAGRRALARLADLIAGSREHAEEGQMHAPCVPKAAPCCRETTPPVIVVAPPTIATWPARRWRATAVRSFPCYCRTPRCMARAPCTICRNAWPRIRVKMAGGEYRYQPSRRVSPEWHLT